jgi:hypothetical protein
VHAMTIGQLSARSGLPVRTLRFYADARVLPEAGRSDAGYRLFDADAVAAVFGDHPSPVADRLRLGAPELPDDPTADQVAAWVELAELLRDPDYVEAGRRMAERADAEGAGRDGAHFAVEAVGEHAGAAVRAGVDPSSPEALAVIERVEAMTPGGGGERAQLAERIGAFTDRRVLRYWTLVGIVNGWSRSPVREDAVDAWEWYAKALRAHAG